LISMVLRASKLTGYCFLTRELDTKNCIIENVLNGAVELL